MTTTATFKPHHLKGGTYYYRGKVYQIKGVCIVDGQYVFATDSYNIKIDKSAMNEELSQFKTLDGASVVSKQKPPKNRVPNVLGAKQSVDPIKTEDAPADHYYGTRDYEKFVFNRKNRGVNKVHVKNLVDSIKKNDLLFAQPILVNDKYEVIDGQHRLTAAQKLNKRIYYIIKPGLSIEDAIALNVNTKNWSYKDYLHYWIEQENQNYIYFQNFLDKYRISYSISASLVMHGRASSGQEMTKTFNNGDLQITHKEYAEGLGQLILDLSEYSSFTNDRSFVMALHLAIQSGEFDPDVFKTKVQLAPDRFTKCSDTDSYLRMMEDVINYHGRGKRIRLY